MSTSVEPAPDLRSGISAITFFAFTMFCIRLWSSIDPQPEPMTLAVQQASEERMSAYFVAAGVMLFGLFVLLRFIVGAVVNGLAAHTGERPRGCASVRRCCSLPRCSRPTPPRSLVWLFSPRWAPTGRWKQPGCGAQPHSRLMPDPAPAESPRSGSSPG